MIKEEFMDADFLLIRKMKQGNDDAFDQFIRKYYEEILGKKARCDIKKGTPMDWKYIE